MITFLTDPKNMDTIINKKIYCFSVMYFSPKQEKSQPKYP